MEEKYIQQFKKGAYEMILLSLIAKRKPTVMRSLQNCRKKVENCLPIQRKAPFILFYTV